jgi:hypothetical protein
LSRITFPFSNPTLPLRCHDGLSRVPSCEQSATLPIHYQPVIQFYLAYILILFQEKIK